MNILLPQSKYAPELLVEISSDYDVYRTGVFKLNIISSSASLGNTVELVNRYWLNIYDQICEYYKAFIFKLSNINYEPIIYGEAESNPKQYVQPNGFYINEEGRTTFSLYEAFKKAMEVRDFKTIKESLIFAYILKYTKDSRLLVTSEGELKLACPSKIVERFKDVIDVSNFTPLVEFDKLLGAA